MAAAGESRTVIEVSGLTKRYGEVEAVRGIDLAVRAQRDLRLARTAWSARSREACSAGWKIVAIDTPEALKASIGKDRVQIHTADDGAAIAALAATFGIEAAVHEGAVTFSVAAGEQFVPRLFSQLDVPIRSVSVSRPSLDDVFMSYTGRTIRGIRHDLRAVSIVWRRELIRSGPTGCGQ